eukprot:Cvel_20549.t2-p1 / transcript=Cvel_20549.t2 / gene=Cvel_20549 / organism=Chromera_velia_CCMP2878 / gene_product=hypothetical protein / transcript_product=hypothetical protein / location=Cvel_scaffold1854:31070-31921(+) / protein_length=284 / sequence_SO=supercontig / SO=protein_coding / is_pseudo=false
MMAGETASDTETAKVSPQEVLRRAAASPLVSYLIGVTGLAVVFIDRLLYDVGGVTDAQGRADIFAILAAGGLLLNGVSKEDIEAKGSEPVVLEGINYSPDSNKIRSQGASQSAALSKLQNSLQWAATTILDTTPLDSVVILLDGRPIWRQGVLPEGPLSVPAIDTTTVLSEASRSSTGRSVTLPDMRFVPDKAQFSFLPSNVQTVVVQPVEFSQSLSELPARVGGAAEGGDDKAEGAGKGKDREGRFRCLLVLGGRRAKVLTPKDTQWIEKLSKVIGRALGEFE